jgi:hypothetical protein
VLNGKADAAFEVKFPAILEHDVLGRIQAIVTAATLDGKSEGGNDPGRHGVADVAHGARRGQRRRAPRGVGREPRRCGSGRVTNATVEALQEASRAARELTRSVISSRRSSKPERTTRKYSQDVVCRSRSAAATAS